MVILPQCIWQHIFEYNVSHRILYKKCMDELMENPWKNFDYLTVNVHRKLIDNLKALKYSCFKYINTRNFTLDIDPYLYYSFINKPATIIQKTGLMVHKKNEETILQILYGYVNLAYYFQYLKVI